MNSSATRPVLLKRLFSSLAAILAVSTIFGVKAHEWEQIAAARDAETAKIAAARLEAGS